MITLINFQWKGPEKLWMKYAILSTHCVLSDIANTKRDPRLKIPKMDPLGFTLPEPCPGQTLLVLPKGLIINWQKELKRHMKPAPSVFVHREADPLSMPALANISIEGQLAIAQRSPVFLSKFEMVITTYETLKERQIAEKPPWPRKASVFLISCSFSWRGSSSFSMKAVESQTLNHRLRTLRGC
jgi:hypothetical protein